VFEQGGMVYQGGTVYYIRYTIFTSLITSVRYTSIYTGRVVVLAMLLPVRVDASCGDLYLRILCTVCFISY